MNAARLFGFMPPPTARTAPTPPTRPTLALLLAGLVAVFAGGCEDPASMERAEVQAELQKIGQELRLASVTAADNATAAASKFDAVVNRLKGVSGGEAGQQAAKSMLMATALRQKAAVMLEQAAKLEQENRNGRAAVNAKADAVQSLNAIAAGHEAIDTAGGREALEQELAAANERLQQLNQELAAVAAPYEATAAENASDKQQADKLRQQSTDLMRQANEQGAAAGFPSHEKAVSVRREADRIDYKIGQREAELHYDLQAQRDLAQARVDHIQAMIAALDVSQQELDAYIVATLESIDATRLSAQMQVTEARTALEDIDKRDSGELRSLYDQAVAALEEAASQARSAASGLQGEDSQAAKLASARTLETLGRTHATIARGWDDQRVVLQRMIDALEAGGAGGSTGGGAGDLKSALDEAEKAHKEAVEKAKAAYTSAQEALASVTARESQAELDQFRNGIETMLAALEGREPALISGSTSADSVDASGAAAGAQPPGAESPEALAQELRGIDSIREIPRMLDLMAPMENAPPHQQKIMEGVKGMMLAVVDLDAAVQEKFQKSLEEAMGQSPDGMDVKEMMLMDAQVESVTDDTGTMTVTTNDGSTRTSPIKRIDGRWYFEAEGSKGLGEFSGADLSSAGGPAADSPEMQAMVDGMMAGMTQMFDAMSDVYRELAAAVRNDEFATFEEFKVEAERKNAEMMQKAMGGGIPGMPGGAGGPGGAPNRPGTRDR